MIGQHAVPVSHTHVRETTCWLGVWLSRHFSLPASSHFLLSAVAVVAEHACTVSYMQVVTNNVYRCMIIVGNVCTSLGQESGVC